MVFGWKGLPVYDLSRAHYALGVGADFLGGWASPVYYARQFGEFRQGRRADPRPARPGRIAPLDYGRRRRPLAAAPSRLGAAVSGGRRTHAAGCPAGAQSRSPSQVRGRAFQSVDPAALLAACGLEEQRVRQIVQELGESEAPLVLAGASMVHTNSLDAIVASHYVNLMLGQCGQTRRRAALPRPPRSPPRIAPAFEHSRAARVVLIDGANPVYTMPRSAGVADALARAELVIALGTFLDDSAAWSDLLLPDHHPLESAMALCAGGLARSRPSRYPRHSSSRYTTRAPSKATLAELARQNRRRIPAGDAHGHRPAPARPAAMKRPEL